jgi:FG-GAP-like repeat
MFFLVLCRAVNQPDPNILRPNILGIIDKLNGRCADVGLALGRPESINTLLIRGQSVINRMTAAILAVALWAPASAHAEYALASYDRVPVTTPAYSGRPPLVGDFTGDLQDDIVVQDGNDNYVLMTRLRSGFTQTDVHACVRDGVYCASGAIATDLNNDGMTDLVLAEWDGNTGAYAVIAVLATGHGAFATTSTPMAESCNPLQAADFDGDGNRDLLAQCGNWPTFTGRILRGDGRGGFSVGGVIAEAIDYRTAVTDWSGDGMPDLVRIQGSRLQVLVNDADGGFAFAHDVELPQAYGYWALKTGDFDGDGRSDALVLSEEYPSSSFKGLIYVQAANGQPSAATPLPMTALPSGLAVVDLDRDGFSDILSGDRNMQQLFRYMNGVGGFRPATANATAWNANFTVSENSIGDVDGDGCNDVVLAEDQYGLNILRGLCDSPTANSESLQFTWRRVTAGLVFGLKNTDRIGLEFSGNVRIEVTPQDRQMTPFVQTAGCFPAGDANGTWYFDCLVSPLAPAQTQYFNFYIYDPLERERTSITVKAMAKSLIVGEPVLAVFDRRLPVSLNAYRGH